MIKIANHLHQYVPLVEHTADVFIPSINDAISVVNTVCHPILFGGDQLTVPPTRGFQVAMSDAPSLSKRLEGLIPCSCRGLACKSSVGRSKFAISCITYV